MASEEKSRFFSPSIFSQLIIYLSACLYIFGAFKLSGYRNSFGMKMDYGSFTIHQIITNGFTGTWQTIIGRPCNLIWFIIFSIICIIPFLIIGRCIKNKVCSSRFYWGLLLLAMFVFPWKWGLEIYYFFNDSTKNMIKEYDEAFKKNDDSFKKLGYVSVNYLIPSRAEPGTIEGFRLIPSDKYFMIYSKNGIFFIPHRSIISICQKK